MEIPINIKAIEQVKGSAETPWYEMTLSLGDGNTQQINIYRDSTPEEWAFEYCKSNDLDYGTLNTLTKAIKEIITKNMENEGKWLEVNERSSFEKGKTPNWGDKNIMTSISRKAQDKGKGNVVSCKCNIRWNGIVDAVNVKGKEAFYGGVFNADAIKHKEESSYNDENMAITNKNKGMSDGKEYSNMRDRHNTIDHYQWIPDETRINTLTSVHPVLTLNIKEIKNMNTQTGTGTGTGTRDQIQIHKPEKKHKLFPYQFYIQEIPKSKSKTKVHKSNISTNLVKNNQNITTKTSQFRRSNEHGDNKAWTWINTSTCSNSRQSVHNKLYEEARMKRIGYRRPCHFSSSSAEKKGRAYYNNNNNNSQSAKTTWNISTGYSRISSDSSPDKRYTKAYLINPPYIKDLNCAFRPEINTNTYQPTIIHNKSNSINYNFTRTLKGHLQTPNTKPWMKSLHSSGSHSVTKLTPKKSKRNWSNTIRSSSVSKGDIYLEELREEAFSNWFIELNNNNSSAVWSRETISEKNIPKMIVDTWSDVIHDVKAKNKVLNKAVFINEMKDIFKDLNWDLRRNILNLYKNSEKQTFQQFNSRWSNAGKTAHNWGLKQSNRKKCFRYINTECLTKSRESSCVKSMMNISRSCSNEGMGSTNKRLFTESSQSNGKRNFYYVI